MMKDAWYSLSKTSELIIEAWLSVLRHDKALVTPVRLVTVLKEFRESLESSSATAPALQCEVGDWNHSRHTQREKVVQMLLHYFGGCRRFMVQTWRNSLTDLDLCFFTDGGGDGRHCICLCQAEVLWTEKTKH